MNDGPSYGDGTFATATELDVGGNPEGILAGDIDGDGIVDLATSNWGSEDVSILLGSGGGVFGPPSGHGSLEHPSGLAFADLDCDGLLDLVVSNSSSHDISVFTSQVGE